jgi:anti-sigma factor RsiW
MLDEPARAELEAHLKSCGRCRELLRELEGVRRALGVAGRAGAGTAPAGAGGGRQVAGPGCPDAELLAAYADGSLDRLRAPSVEAHLAGCPSCLAEVADLMALSAAPGREAPDRAVERVLVRLDREPRTAIVRLAERSLVLIRDFGRAAVAGPGAPAFDAAEPAFATARSGRAPLRLRWSEGGLEVECEIRKAEEGALLTGRVTSGGEPARAVSVALTTAAGTSGPESADARGRFGPWPLPAGRNTLVLAGGGGDVALELAIEVEAERPEAGAGG